MKYVYVCITFGIAWGNSSDTVEFITWSAEL